MDGVEWQEWKSSILGGRCKCIQTAMFNSRGEKEGGVKPLEDFFKSRALHFNQQTLVVAVVVAGAHSQRYQRQLLMMLQMPQLWLL